MSGCWDRWCWDLWDRTVPCSRPPASCWRCQHLSQELISSNVSWSPGETSVEAQRTFSVLWHVEAQVKWHQRPGAHVTPHSLSYRCSERCWVVQQAWPPVMRACIRGLVILEGSLDWELGTEGCYCQPGFHLSRDPLPGQGPTWEQAPGLTGEARGPHA